jgi:U4/U6 small nuclear ribonucleoprotein PRP3
MVEKRPFPGDHGANGVKRPKPTMPGGAMDKVAAAKAQAEAKAAEIKARLSGGAAFNGVSPSPTPPPSEAPSSGAVGNRLAELKARLAKSRPSAGPPTSTSTPSIPNREDSESRNNDSKGPRFATTLGNKRTDSPLPSAKPHAPAAPKPTDEKENPYFDPKAVSTGRTRVSRGLLFNQRGKYLDQASKLRAQNRLEQLKKILADKNRRAKLDENSERGFLVPQPPDVEWWDEGILEDKTYDCIEDPLKVKIDGDDSIITVYVQHPVLLKAPQDQLLIPVKPMYLTSKEQAKLRRMRRADEHKEQQAKIRLGLEPPPPPKVKRGNMMRVMGEQAIADPTAVEMLVESQIQDRHEVSNPRALPPKLLICRMLIFA